MLDDQTTPTHRPAPRTVSRAELFPTWAVVRAAALYTAVVSASCLITYTTIVDASPLLRGFPAQLVAGMACLLAHRIMHRGRQRRLAQWGIGPLKPVSRSVHPRLIPDYCGAFLWVGAIIGAGGVRLLTDGSLDLWLSGGLVGASFGLYVGGVYTQFVRSERVWRARDVDG